MNRINLLSYTRSKVLKMNKYCIKTDAVRTLFKSSYSTGLTKPANNLVEVFINGQPIQIESGSAVIQACALAGIDIPRFCYHERLSVAGNCRMCLVEVEKSPKPIASCAMPISPGMRVWTNTESVKKAREGVMEFLLANHPLDCAICDQGGECDLQDQSMAFGSDRGRFTESYGKRAVEDKHFGPLVKTTMTRCIHCTRCVRFGVELGGMEELGTTGRGADMQIGTYVESFLKSELSGNIIDLCPVGALTSKPYAFTARPWELKHTESIDVLDAVGSNIRIDSKGPIVMRILPRLNESINEEWLADKSRFSYDGLNRQRLLNPMVRTSNGFIPISWEKAFGLVLENVSRLHGSEIVGYVGGLADVESTLALKEFLMELGSSQIYLDTAPILDSNETTFHRWGSRNQYICNTKFINMEDSDCILLIGTNPKWEAPLLNLRLRKAYVYKGANIALIGKAEPLNYPYSHLGDTLEALKDVIDESSSFWKSLSEAKRPMLLIGWSIFERPDVRHILELLQQLITKLQGRLFTESWNGVNIVHREAGRVGALDLGILPFIASSSNVQTAPKLVYLLNADSLEEKQLPSDAFVVYQGHSGDLGAQYAHLILPGAAYTEKDATFVNTEGKAQMTKAAVPPPPGAREDWTILRALSEVMGRPLPYEDRLGLRQRMHQIQSLLCQLEYLPDTPVVPSSVGFNDLFISGAKKKKYNLKGIILENRIEDYYLTDPISKNSITMAKCSKAFLNNQSIQLDEHLLSENGSL